MSDSALNVDEPLAEEETGPALASGGMKPVQPEGVEVTGEMDALRIQAADRKRQTQMDYEADRAERWANKDYDGDGTKDNVWGRLKGWWKKGKDDPSTDVDESVETYQDADGNWQERPVQVTGFMGGMTRQELATFVFQWGASMMVNADKGLGGAFGQSALDAEGAHRGRQMQQAETEKSDAQQKIQNQLDKQKADAMTTSAEASAADKANIQWTKDGAVSIVPDGQGGWKAEPLTDAEGNQQQPGLTPGSKQGQFRDQWMYDQMIAAGYTERQAVDFINGAPTESEVKLTVQRIWLAYDDRQKLRSPISKEVKNKSEFTDDEYKAWLEEQIGAWSAGGALPPTTNPGKDAVDEYSERK